jgi:hypothetical protein
MRSNSGRNGMARRSSCDRPRAASPQEELWVVRLDETAAPGNGIAALARFLRESARRRSIGVHGDGGEDQS